MIQFKHLDYDKCPDCGASIVEAKYLGTHTNGHQREYMRFACEKVIEYSPNYRTEFVRSACTRAEEYQQEIGLAVQNARRAIEWIMNDRPLSSIRKDLTRFVDRYSKGEMMENLEQEFIEEVLLYLDDLRESGITNMFDAAPYIVDEFGVDKHTAKKLK